MSTIWRASRPRKRRELFNLPPGLDPVTMIAVGYLGDPEQLSDTLKARELAQQQRKPLEELVDWGTRNAR